MQHTLSYTSASASSLRPWAMLLARSVLFVVLQALFALGFYLAGSASAWDAGAAWWPLVVTLANLLCIVALIRLYQAEGKRYWDIFRLERRHLLGDVLLLVGVLVIGGPLAYFPNVLLAGWLFDDPQTVLTLFVRPLPLWAAWVGIVIFPVTQGLAEIATYMAYVMPRTEAQGLRPWQAVLLSGLFLGFQHAAAPLLFDGRFFLWRLLMYVPFACWVALLMRWRPRLLPYLALVHVLMNMSFMLMFLSVAY
jgi:hypothetical protein